jgi:hypothetical protein
MGVWLNPKLDTYVMNAGEFHPDIWGNAQNAALITAFKRKLSPLLRRLKHGSSAAYQAVPVHSGLVRSVEMLKNE